MRNLYIKYYNGIDLLLQSATENFITFFVSSPLDDGCGRISIDTVGAYQISIQIAR